MRIVKQINNDDLKRMYIDENMTLISIAKVYGFASSGPISRRIKKMGIKVKSRSERVDLVGNIYGKLTVIARAAIVNQRAMWTCRCECRKILDVIGPNLVRGNSNSCGDGMCTNLIKKLSGKIIGKLEVIRFDKINERGRAYWVCKCECGTIKSLKGLGAKNGPRSCGSTICTGLMDNIVGRTYGKLTVVAQDRVDKNGNLHWQCVCGCGKYSVVQGSHLKSGTSKSCGDSMCNGIMKDLGGVIFGKLTAIKPHRGTDNKIYWDCKCSCGDMCVVKGSYLRSGDTTSCGCKPVFPKLRNEKTLMKILEEVFPNFHIKSNYSFPELYNKSTKRFQRVDIAVLNKNKDIEFVVEYDGEQHFYPVNFGGMSDEKAESVFINMKKRDARKVKILKENNIKLVRFTYKDRTRRKEISKELVISRLNNSGIVIGQSIRQVNKN